MKARFVMIAALSAAASSVAGAQCASAPTAARQACYASQDLVNYITPQFATAIAGGSSTLGQSGVLGGLGRFALSLRGTVVIVVLGLIGLFFLNRSTLRGLWDEDLSAYQKLFIPFGVGVLFGLVNLVSRRSIPIDEMLASFAKTEPGQTIAPSLPGSILAYSSGAISS